MEKAVPIIKGNICGPKISVCLAAYNGAEYIGDQIASILQQLAPDDELIVIDDASTDNTVAVVNQFNDPRLKLIKHQTNAGYVKTFQEALQAAQGEYLFIADQDDIWLPGRVAAMCRALDTSDVVATNLAVLDPDNYANVGKGLPGPFGQSDWHLKRADAQKNFRNLLGIYAGNRPYYGSAMALRKEALRTILPFAKYLPEHYDLWIAIYGNLARSISHLELRSVAHRFHGANDTPNRPRWHLIIWTRARLLLVTAQLGWRILRNRRAKVNS